MNVLLSTAEQYKVILWFSGLNTLTLKAVVTLNVEIKDTVSYIHGDYFS